MAQAALSSLSHKELQKLCKDRGLPASGKTKVLITRLEVDEAVQDSKSARQSKNKAAHPAKFGNQD